MMKEAANWVGEGDKGVGFSIPDLLGDFARSTSCFVVVLKVILLVILYDRKRWVHVPCLINHVLLVVSRFIAVSAQESSAFTDKVFLLGYSSKNKFCEYVLV